MEHKRGFIILRSFTYINGALKSRKIERDLTG